MNPKPNFNSLRIATWNLNYAPPQGERGEACKKQMALVDADVWILTETRVDFVVPGFQLVVFSGQVPGIEQNGWWVSIWVKKPLFVSRVTVPTNDPERTACSVIKLASHPDLIVYGVVLPWHGDPRKGSRDWQKTFLASLELLRQDIKNLQAEYPEHIFCVAGDFNQALLDIPHAYGKDAGREALEQTLKELELTCYTGGKNDPVNAIAPEHANIDHICLGRLPTGNEEITVGAWPKEVYTVKVTDHFGVCVNIPLQASK